MIPLKVLSNHLVILGKTGSGKTYTAKGIVEGLLDRDERVCVVDPTSAWHGLRTSANGKKAGYPVVIFGGPHADFPLNPNAGAALAEIIGTTDMSAVIDTRLLSVGERTRFFTDFAETLLRVNKGTLHLVIDEAHLFAPQGRVNDPQSGKMVNATNNLVSLGRGIGLRVIMISQRPAKLHKDSLTQAESLIAMRLIAPQDRRAVEDWIGEWADPEEGKEIVRGLPSLETGSGWLWAPGLNILKAMIFPEIKTYDSSKAPDGKAKKVVLAKIDMVDVEKKLAAAATELKENDPKSLKAEIAKLKAALKQPAKENRPSPKELQAEFEDGRKLGFQQGADAAWGEIAKIAAKRPTTRFEHPAPSIQYKKETSFAAKPLKNVHLTKAPKKPSSDLVIGNGLRKILSALAQYPQGRTKSQVALLTGYSVTSGGLANYLSQLRSAGYISGGGDRMTISDEGLQVLGDFDPLPTGTDLQKFWLSKLGKAERAVLSAAISRWPGTITKEEVADATGYSVTSGGLANALSKLRTYELIHGGGANIQASEDLFDED